MSAVAAGADSRRLDALEAELLAGGGGGGAAGRRREYLRLARAQRVRRSEAVATIGAQLLGSPKARAALGEELFVVCEQVRARPAHSQGARQTALFARSAARLRRPLRAWRSRRGLSKCDRCGGSPEGGAPRTPAEVALACVLACLSVSRNLPPPPPVAAPSGAFAPCELLTCQ